MDVRIIGLGNVLMGDDGVGPFVVKALEAKFVFPPEVSLIDAGTPGLDLLPFLVDADVVILVDTVNASDAPGTVKLYDRAALLKHAPQPRTSPHDPGVKQTLLALEFSARAPREVIVIGVVPESVEAGPGLSAAARRGAAVAADRVVYELERLGIRARRDVHAAAPDIWWEQRPVGPFSSSRP
jgi:hydrogenase maturation protease